MPTVNYNSVDYACTTAIKGTDYIHILDANGNMVVAFDGVSDFTGFTITGGGWTTPATPDNCYLVTRGQDGVLRTGTHKCSDIIGNSQKGVSNGVATLDGNGKVPKSQVAGTATVTISVSDWGGGTTCTKNVTGATSDNIILTEPSNALVSCTGQGAGTLTFTAISTPTSTVTVKVVIFG